MNNAIINKDLITAAPSPSKINNKYTKPKIKNHYVGLIIAILLSALLSACAGEKPTVPPVTNPDNTSSVPAQQTTNDPRQSGPAAQCYVATPSTLTPDLIEALTDMVNSNPNPDYRNYARCALGMPLPAGEKLPVDWEGKLIILDHPGGGVFLDLQNSSIAVIQISAGLPKRTTQLLFAKEAVGAKWGLAMYNELLNRAQSDWIKVTSDYSKKEICD
jgi:hypothetical protein